MVAVNHGSTLVLPSPHFTPERSLEAIVNEKCNVIYGTPTSECICHFVFVVNLKYPQKFRVGLENRNICGVNFGSINPCDDIKMFEIICLHLIYF
jgi:hypothetical protein